MSGARPGRHGARVPDAARLRNPTLSRRPMAALSIPLNGRPADEVDRRRRRRRSQKIDSKPSRAWRRLTEKDAYEISSLGRPSVTEALGSDSKGGQLASSGPIIGTAKGPVPTAAWRGAILGWRTRQERVTDMHMMQTPRRAPDTDLQKVVVVNGSPEILEMLETVLDAGRYDMVFVESSARVYRVCATSSRTWSSCACVSTMSRCSSCSPCSSSMLRPGVSRSSPTPRTWRPTTTNRRMMSSRKTSSRSPARR